MLHDARQPPQALSQPCMLHLSCRWSGAMPCPSKVLRSHQAAQQVLWPQTSSMDTADTGMELTAVKSLDLSRLSSRMCRAVLRRWQKPRWSSCRSWTRSCRRI